MSRTRVFLVLLAAELLTVSGLLFHAGRARGAAEDRLAAGRSIVRALSLTDLSLWTEARYTRHPSQADLFAAFQDAPGAIDHFPAGSFTLPVRDLFVPRGDAAGGAP